MIYTFRGDYLKIFKKKKHSILGLYNSMKTLIKDYLSDICDKDKEDMKLLDEYIMQIHQEDCLSDKFRYPIDNNFIEYFINKRYNKKNITEGFEAILDFLDAILNSIIQYNSFKKCINNYKYFTLSYCLII